MIKELKLRNLLVVLVFFSISSFADDVRKLEAKNPQCQKELEEFVDDYTKYRGQLHFDFEMSRLKQFLQIRQLAFSESAFETQKQIDRYILKALTYLLNANANVKRGLHTVEVREFKDLFERVPLQIDPSQNDILLARLESRLKDSERLNDD
ncbi:hypothetical protein MHM98_09050 [Psychrobium sp. MM17-31]|uniref:hypothetical protein n=1 Tax=Psychrobium sp. MM17-31 TaxID=2917758 RepID=UPI001EF54642|nr:hypothetical protein [Psychrobium sp. MM17-31]MCG7531493.1 hypothetical protein [Psychrobium sp. MM17-31]